MPVQAQQQQPSVGLPADRQRVAPRCFPVGLGGHMQVLAHSDSTVTRDGEVGMPSRSAVSERLPNSVPTARADSTRVVPARSRRRWGVSAPMTDLTLALDIGGTKIAAGLVDPDGAVVRAERLPTPPVGAEAIWRVVEDLIARMTTDATVRGAGIASAGPVDLPAGTVSPLNVPSWQGFPIRDRVAAALGGRPVRLAGDGLCMTLGEHWRGAGRGRSSCWARWSRPASAAAWCSTASRTTAGPATPGTSGTWWWSRPDRRAPAGAGLRRGVRGGPADGGLGPRKRLGRRRRRRREGAGEAAAAGDPSRCGPSSAERPRSPR